MKIASNFADNPLVQGIKTIGIGKHGSKPLPLPLLEEIEAYLQAGDVVPIQKGAFYGALMAKGPTLLEERLLNNSLTGSLYSMEELYQNLCADSPAAMQELGIKLLRKETLTDEEARVLGDYLFSDHPGETFRGMVVSMLRIRYETEAEYKGLQDAAAATYMPEFTGSDPIPPFAIQIAEPFDGVEHSYMITPLIAEAFRKNGFTVITSLGRTSGPKVSLNSLDIYQELNGRFLENKQQLKEECPPFGWALDQKTFSPPLDNWVERRKLIFKRPFLATSEKVFNPLGARILVTSVFHLTYMEKMISLAAMTGFTGVIVLKRGLEGTLAPSLSKASGILCGAQQPDGSFKTTTFDAADAEFAPFRAEVDEHVEPLQLKENIQLILAHSKNGSSGNEDFDKRVGLANSLYGKGLEWIVQHS